MSEEAKLALGTITQIFFILFMVGSGLWVALNAKKHGRPPSEYMTWGLFAGAFVFLGLIVYLLWRKHLFKHQE